MENNMRLSVRYSTHRTGWFDLIEVFKSEEDFKAWYASMKRKHPYFRVWRKTWGEAVPTYTQRFPTIASPKTEGSTDACIMGMDY